MNNLPDRILILCDALDEALKPTPPVLTKQEMLERLVYLLAERVEVEELEELFER